MLVSTNVSVYVVCMWEETRVLGWNPSFLLRDHMTISHADTVYQTLVAAVRGKCFTTAQGRQLFFINFRFKGIKLKT